MCLEEHAAPLSYTIPPCVRGIRCDPVRQPHQLRRVVVYSVSDNALAIPRVVTCRNRQTGAVVTQRDMVMSDIYVTIARAISSRNCQTCSLFLSRAIAP